MDRLDIVIKAINEASSELNKIQSDLAGVGKSAMSTQSTLTKVSQGLSGFSQQVGQVGVALTASITAPVVLLGKTMLDQVANIEQLRVSFDTMLGSAEEGAKALNRVQEFAAKTPFDLPQVAEGAKQLLAYGYTSDELLDNLRMLGDVAAGVNAPIGDLVYLQGTLKAQGQAYKKDIMQLANRGIPIYEELAKVFGVTTDKVQALVTEGKVGFEEVQQAFVNMTSEGGKFYNLMENQSKTFDGVMSNLKDNFVRVSLALLGLSIEAENFGEVIEGGVFDTLKNVLQGALVALNDLVAWFNELDLSTKNTIIAVAAFVAALGPLALLVAGVSAVLATLLSVTGLVVVAIGAIGVAFIVFRDAIGQWMAEASKMKMVQDLGVILQNFGKIIQDWVVPMLNDLGGAMAWVWEAFKDNTIAQMVLPALETLISLLTWLTSAIVDSGMTWETYKLGMQVVWLEVVKAVEWAAARFVMAMAQMSGASVEQLDDMNAALADRMEELNNEIEGKYTEMNRVVADGEQKKLESIEDSLAKQLDIVETGTEEMKETAIMNYGKMAEESLVEAGKLTVKMEGEFLKAKQAIADATEGTKKEALENYATLVKGALESSMKVRTGTTGELAKMRNEAKQVIAANFAGLLVDMYKWGSHLMDNLSKGILGKIPALAGAVGAAKKIIYSLHQSYNPELPAQEWGEHLLINFAAGVDLGTPTLENSLDDVADLFRIFATDIRDIFKGIAEETTGLIDAGDWEKMQSQIEGGLKTLREAMEELRASSEKFNSRVFEVEAVFKGEDLPVIISDYNTLDRVLTEIENEVMNLNSAHDTFIDNALIGLEGFEEKIEGIRQKYSELADTISEKGAQDAVKELTASLKERERVEESLLRLREQYANTGSSETASQISELEAQLSLIKALENEFANLKNEATSYTTQLETLDASIEKSTEGSEERLKLEAEKSNILMEQKVVNDILAAAEAKRQDDELRATLTSLEYNRLKTKEALLQNAEVEASAIRSAEELKKVQEAIVAGTIGDLDTTGFGDEATALAEKARLENELYQAQLNEQYLLLEEAKKAEAELYLQTTQEIEEYQSILEDALKGSYDRLIEKLKQVEKAAIAAFTAQQKVSGGGAFAGGQFAGGGYTGGGNTRDVAGVVHKGEWVAPNWMVKSFRPMFGFLENMRRNKAQGYADGGMVGGATTNVPITMNNNISSNIDFDLVAKNISWILKTS